MKPTFSITRSRRIPLVLALSVCVLLSASLAGAGPAGALASENAQEATLGSGFTYQGRLTDNGNPANGSYDLRFTLFDASTGGAQVGSQIAIFNQAVANGLFTVALDFGTTPFKGEARFLQLEVKPAGGGSYTLLSPRQPLTPAPYALTLRPGASIEGSSGSALLALSNAGTNGIGLYGIATGGTIAKGVSGESTNGYGGFFTSSTGVGVSGSGADGVTGTGTASNGSGVRGTANNGTGARGVLGISSSGSGVYGTSTSGAGVYGTSTSGYGGDFRSTSGTGINVTGSNGTYSLGTSSNGVGLWGVANNGSNAKGVYGTSTTGYGIYGSTTALGGRAISGIADNGQSAAGVFGTSINGTGVQGTTNTGQGIYGIAATSGYGGYFSSETGTGIYTEGGNGIYSVGTATNGIGVWGVGNAGTTGIGVYGSSTASSGRGIEGHANSFAIFGSSGTGWAGFFSGDVYVSGSCCGAGQAYTRIDHPLDPENKYLNQSLIQSPEMLSLINGNTRLDSKGEAIVSIPDWFAASNTDFRYTLTPIGAPGPNLYIAEEITGNTFIIAGGAPNAKVSWQVTGTRTDPYAASHPIEVEQSKPLVDTGKYIHPEEYDQPGSKQLEPNLTKPYTNP